MTEVNPMTTTDAGNTGAGQQATEAQELRAQLYGYRREADPILYDRVVAFHPHAATSSEALATFKADLDRATAEAQAKLEGMLPPPV